MTRTRSNKSRACVKSPGLKFGNDQIFRMARFDESSRWIGWSKNEFSHSLALQATAAAPVSGAIYEIRLSPLHFGVRPSGFG